MKPRTRDTCLAILALLVASPLMAAAGQRASAGPMEASVVYTLGGHDATEETAFQWVPMMGSIAVSEQHTLFVLDRRRKEILVFGPDGSFQRRIGQPGQGPGDLSSPTAIAIAGNELLVVDRYPRRVQRWTLDGNFVRIDLVEDVTRRESIREIFGLPSGEYYQLSESQDLLNPEHGTELPARVWRLTRHDTRGNEVAELWRQSRTIPLTLHWPTSSTRRRGYRVSMLGFQSPYWVIFNDALCGVFTEAYEVQCFNEQGIPSWSAASASAPRHPVLSEERSVVETYLSESVAAIYAEADLTWPSVHPALAQRGRPIAADGQGRLYVFPMPKVRPSSRTTLRPVDVYERQGERIYSGMVRGLPAAWSIAVGDSVYSVERTPPWDEIEIVRYALHLPF